MESLFICLSIDTIFVRIVLLYGARAGWVNWGQHQEVKVAKLIGLNGKCVLYQVFGFPFVSVCTSTHGPFIALNPPKLWGDCGAMNGPWVCVRTLTKGKPKTWYNTHFPFNPINFATLTSWGCPQFTHPARAPVKQSSQLGINRKANKQAFQRYLTWWIKIKDKEI